MKIWKLISLLLLVICLGACDDDKISDDENQVGTDPTQQPTVQFDYDAKTVLKNTGQVLIPIKLEHMAGEPIKITVNADKGDSENVAREGIDFNLPEKVVVIPIGDTIAFLKVDVLDNEKAENNRVVKLNITGAYGGKVGTQPSCSLYIVSNSFVEFEKENWETYESAGLNGSSEIIKNSRFVPLVISGEITETATLVLGIIDSTAIEPTHFTIEKEIIIQPGDTRVLVEIQTIDDNLVNDDRLFSLYIKEIKGGNLRVGKVNQGCKVKIISEEVIRILSWDITSLDKTDDEEELTITVSIDKGLTQELSLKITADATSTAVEGTDYELLTKEIVIGESRQAKVKVKILGDTEINADRILSLIFTEVSDHSVTVNEEAKSLTIRINNNDLPSFDADAQEALEDATNNYRIHVPSAVNRERKFTLECESTEPKVGTYFNIPATVTVTVPANKTSVDLPLDVKYTTDFPTAIPSLAISIVKVDDLTLNRPVKTTLNLAPCPFRKLLGEWDVNLKTVDNCKAKTTATITSVAWQKEVKVVVASLWNNRNIYFNMIFDKKTQKASIILNKKCEDSTWNFGAPNTSVVLRLLVASQYNLTDVEMGGYDPEKGILTLPIDKRMGGGGANSSMTNNPTVWGFFFTNGTFVKR